MQPVSSQSTTPDHNRSPETSDAIVPSPIVLATMSAINTGTTSPSTSIEGATKIPANSTAAIRHTFTKAVTGNGSCVDFTPSKSSWNKELGSIESFLCTIFAKGSFFFRGKVDLQRFVEAMQETLNAFDFLYGKIHVVDSRIIISYTQERDKVTLEIKSQTGSMKSATAASTLPDKFDKRATKGLVNQLENLPMASFKLTQFDDGFAIGYYLNHAFMDQSSTVYFFQCLSRKYNGGPDLKAPTLCDLDAIAKEDSCPIVANTAEEFRSLGEQIGYTYLKDKVALLKHLLGPDSRLVLGLRFNLVELQKYKEKCTSYVSDNDLIHAILLKIYAHNPDICGKDEYTYSFACNMRRHLKLGHETIGNVLASCRISGLKTDILRKADLLYLAQRNRAELIKMCKETYVHGNSWFSNFRTIPDKPTDFLPSFIVKPLEFCTSNWLRFDYSQITFDNQEPVFVTSPTAARFNLSLISFDARDGEKVLTTDLAIPPSSLQYAKDLAKQCGLFTVQVTEEGQSWPVRLRANLFELLLSIIPRKCIEKLIEMS